MPLQRELTVTSESIIPNARAFVRSLNVLLKYTRLYGLDHLRSAGQFEISWNELEQAVRTAGQGGLLLGASGSQLLLDGVPLESTQAERSFADLLNAAGVASISFLPSVERDEFGGGNPRERDSICCGGCGLLRSARRGAIDGANPRRRRRYDPGLVSQPRENDSVDRRGRRRARRQRRIRKRSGPGRPGKRCGFG